MELISCVGDILHLGGPAAEHPTGSFVRGPRRNLTFPPTVKGGLALAATGKLSWCTRFAAVVATTGYDSLFRLFGRLLASVRQALALQMLGNITCHFSGRFNGVQESCNLQHPLGQFAFATHKVFLEFP